MVSLDFMMFIIDFLSVGAWRSLVAHFAGGEGVGGSNPLAPTNKNNGLAKIGWAIFLFG